MENKLKVKAASRNWKTVVKLFELSNLKSCQPKTQNLIY